jgi:hypothetical protein
MIERLQDVPDGVLGFRAIWDRALRLDGAKRAEAVLPGGSRRRRSGSRRSRARQAPSCRSARPRRGAIAEQWGGGPAGCRVSVPSAGALPKCPWDCRSQRFSRGLEGV